MITLKRLSRNAVVFKSWGAISMAPKDPPKWHNGITITLTFIIISLILSPIGQNSLIYIFYYVS